MGAGRPGPPSCTSVGPAGAGGRGGRGRAKDSRLGAANRRVDHKAREYIETLLKHFRQFYTTCHLMAAGQLEPKEAKSRAAEIERELNTLLAEVTDVARKISG